MTRSQMRSELRQRRRQLQPDYREAANRALCLRIRALKQYRDAKTVAIYLPFDGEADPTALSTDDKAFFVPILQGRNDPLRFARYQPESELENNRFGILEPSTERPESAEIAPRDLELVVTPLVGFDTSGTRLGVGGGFYDRTFEFLRDPDIENRSLPFLLGFAFEIQRISGLVREDWDIPLDGVATDERLYWSVSSRHTPMQH